MKVHSSYLECVMNTNTLPGIVTLLQEHIEASGIEFGAIAFRGMSGALVVPLLAVNMKKGIIVCRKPDEGSHGYPVEGFDEGGPYIIVDDFMDEGTTVNSIIESIDKYIDERNATEWFDHTTYKYRARTEAERIPDFQCAGIFLYKVTTDGIHRCRTSPYYYGKYDIDHRDSEVPVFGTMLPAE